MPKIITEEISEDIHLLRVDDDRVKSFEAIWGVPEGATYNAYLLKTEGKTVLFDGWKKNYESEFVETLQRLTRIEDIDYIVVHHAEPDHSGTLAKILELNGYRAQVFGHAVAGRLLNAFYAIGERMKFHAVEDGEELKVGTRTLRFLHTPWLHWPDTICTYIKEEGLLFSGDAFGGFSMPQNIFDDDISDYMPFVRKYIANVIGHYKEHITKNLEKIEKSGIEISMIAPLHGLIWKRDPSRIVEFYRAIAEGRAEKGKVLVVYNSMYGFVEGSINHALEILREAGCKTKVFRFTDEEQASLSEILGEIPDSEAIILGVSTYEAGAFPMMNFLATQIAHKTDYRKPVLIISSYGWGSAAVREISNTLEKTKLEVRAVVEYRGLAGTESLNRLDEALKGLLV